MMIPSGFPILLGQIGRAILKTIRKLSILRDAGCSKSHNNLKITSEHSRKNSEPLLMNSMRKTIKNIQSSKNSKEN